MREANEKRPKLLYCSEQLCIYLGLSVPVRLDLILQAKFITKDDYP